MVKKIIQDLKRSWIGLTVCVLSILFLNYLRCPPCYNNPWDIFFTVLFTTIITLVLWMGNSWVQDLVDRYVSWIEAPLKRLLIGVFAMITYTWVISFIVASIFWMSLGTSFQVFVQRELPGLSVSVIVITAIISLIMHGRSFLLNWRKAALELETVKREKLASQYQGLKEQLNPHFLFNNLNSLTALIHKDPDKAVAFVKQLSQVYRYVLENSPKEVIPLTEELSFINSYLHLLHIRFGKALKVIQEVENQGQMVIPPLTLQLLVENVVKHNIISSSKPMKLEILSEEPNYLMVRNTLQKKMDVPPSSGIGLQNIRNRLKFLTDLPLIVMEEENEFIVKVPLMTLAEKRQTASKVKENLAIPANTLNPEP